MTEKERKKNLLVVCHGYNAFVKDWTDEISKSFNNVYVFVRYNTLFDIANILKKGKYSHKTLQYKINNNDKPSNVVIIVNKFFYIPRGFFLRRAGNQHLNSVVKQIEQNNLKFDLIHAHFTWTSGYVASKLKFMYNVPAIITAHGFDIYELPFRDEWWCRKISHLLNEVDYVLTVSKKNMELIASLNTSTEKKVITNGYNSHLFKPKDMNSCRDKLNLPLNKKILLSIGNLVEIKGHKYLLEAVAKLTDKRDDFILIIIGEGPLKDTLKKQVLNLKLENKVKLIGIKPHEEIVFWLGACDLFVLPSLNEGNPTVMFEAMGCGKPFIGTNVGGVPDIINDDKLGIIVESGNSDLLSDSIQKAFQTNWDYEFITESSKKYTWTNVVQQTLSVYDDILNN
ncbi:glycosyltransferase [Methanolobus sp. WCC4]|uniref:glycosyltransferase n=1 Tax=Methanolobus sp. WCC4 TaxID=3125784 RepID=UPI0030FBBB4A